MTKKITKHAARIKSTRNFQKAVDDINDKVSSGVWTAEQAMDALKKLADGGNTVARDQFQAHEASGFETTAERKKDGSDPIGYIAGPKANAGLPTGDDPGDYSGLDDLLGDDMPDDLDAVA